jgi:hypothetical protein
MHQLISKLPKITPIPAGCLAAARAPSTVQIEYIRAAVVRRQVLDSRMAAIVQKVVILKFKP